MNPVLSVQTQKVPQFANASMAGISKFLLRTSAHLGLNLSNHAKAIDCFFETGGYGIVPAIALADDLNQLNKRVHKISNGFSISAQMGLASVGTEVIFDIYELSSSVGKFFHVRALENLADSSSGAAMNIKTLGAVILAASAIDEAYAELSGRVGFLGSKPSFYTGEEVDLSDTFVGKILGGETVDEVDNSSSRNKIGVVLRAAEVGFAALSNLALLIGQGPNTTFAATSVASNTFKYLRMAYNC